MIDFEKLLDELEAEVRNAPPKLKREVRHVMAKVRHIRDYYRIEYLNKLPKEEPKKKGSKE